MLHYVEKHILQSGKVANGALRSVLWMVLWVHLLLAALRKSSDLQLWDALLINKSKNNVCKQNKTLRLK